MGLRQRIISEIYDEQTDKVVNREIVQDKEIKKPKIIDDVRRAWSKSRGLKSLVG